MMETFENNNDTSMEDRENVTINDNFLSNDTRSEQELYQVPLGIVILLSTLYGGISLAAVVGNGLVLWVVAVSRRMRTTTNLFIGNLALADIIIGFFAIPFQFQAALLQKWNLPAFMCPFCPLVQILSVNVSVFTLALIAVDRYRAILYPFHARGSKRKAMWSILSIWILGFFISLPAAVEYRVRNEKISTGETKTLCVQVGLSETFRHYYFPGLAIIQYFFPLLIISVAYLHMGCHLWQSAAPGNAENNRDRAILKNKKKAIKMLALVVLLFGICWLPLQLYNFLKDIYPSINGYQYINIIWFSIHWLAMSNSCCNPFIYAIYNVKFQTEFQNRLHRFSTCCRKERSQDYLFTNLEFMSQVNSNMRYRESRASRRLMIEHDICRNRLHVSAGTPIQASSCV